MCGRVRETETNREREREREQETETETGIGSQRNPSEKVEPAGGALLPNGGSLGENFPQAGLVIST